MTQPLLILNARAALPEGTAAPCWIVCQDGHIAGIGSDAPPILPDAEILDAQGGLVLPGFIDVHTHGGMLHDTMDARPDTLPSLSAFYAQHGVTGFLATTWSESHERISRALENARQALSQPMPGAALLGVHLEGPYLNASKCGAQSPIHIRPAAREEALSYLDTGVIRLISVAPEIEANHWLIAEAFRRGIRVSAAHTAASYEQIAAAVGLGLRHLTHTYNAMTPLHHREPGVVGAALSMDELTCELIADNIHVHPGAMRALYRARGLDGVILISDSVCAAGMPDGEYNIDDRTVRLDHGTVRLPDGALAGSALTMERALVNFAAAVGAPVEQVWPVSSRSAARALGLHNKGEIAVGRDADLVWLADSGVVQATITGGRVVFRREQ
jgi:N-acetylglucosamine-6-phosphate deacetylase